MRRRRSHHIGWLLCPLILLASMISTMKSPSSSLLNCNLYHHEFLYKNSVVLTSKRYSAYMKSIYSYSLLHMNSIQINNNDNNIIYKAAIITVGSNVNVIDDDKIQHKDSYKKKKEFNSFNDGDDSDNDNDNDCLSGRKATSTQRRYNSNYTTTSSSQSSSSYSLNNNNEIINGDTKTIKATGKRFNYTSTSTLASTNYHDPTRYSDPVSYNNPTRYKDSLRYNSKDISTRSYTYKKTFSAEYKNSKYNPTKHILRNTMKLKTYDNYSSSSTSIASISSSTAISSPSSLLNLTASYSDDSNANVNNKNDANYVYNNMKYSELISLSFHYAKMNQPVIVINIIKVIIKNNKKIISIKDINNIIKIIVTKG